MPCWGGCWPASHARPGTLAFEWPGSLLADDRHGLRCTVEQLGQLGLPIWLEDFGAGGDAPAVLRGLITLADSLGLPTCAPGAVGGDQLAALRSVGGAMLQGPWYQPPMAAPEAGAWLTMQAVRPPPSAGPAGLARPP